MMIYTKLSDMLITPVRPTVPNVGRNAVTPHLAAGKVIDPAVSEPIANGTIPAINQQFQCMLNPPPPPSTKKIGSQWRSTCPFSSLHSHNCFKLFSALLDKFSCSSSRGNEAKKKKDYLLRCRQQAQLMNQ